MKQLFLISVFLFSIAGCRSQKMSQNELPSVTSSLARITESDVGVPLYPNAENDRNQSFVFNGPPTAGGVQKTISAAMSTRDSVEQVETFYREKLGRSARIETHESGSGTLVDISLRKGNQDIRIQAVPQAGKTGSMIVILTQVHS